MSAGIVNEPEVYAMKEQKIKEVVTAQLKEIGRLGNRIGRDFDATDIHDFRVKVKTLRSFLRLLRTHPGMEHLRLSKKFKRLYHITGFIRDAQIETARLDSEQLPFHAYRERLSTVLANNKKEWQARYSREIILRQKKDLLAFSTKIMHSSAFHAFVNSRYSTISRISCRKTPTDTDIHTIRKQLKDILYVSKVASKHWPVAKKHIRKTQLKTIDRTADTTGAYNDEVVFLRHIGSFSSRTMPDSEHTAMTRFTGAHSRKLKSGKTKIIADVKDLCRHLKDPDSHV